jgi:clan AA aspartic protease
VGEVRVKARLTNAVDEGLVRRGQLSPDQVRTLVADALVDTGAMRTVLPPDVVTRLGLAIRDWRVTEYADGRRQAVALTEPVAVELYGRNTVEDALMLGDEVLIGQTVLESLDLLVDCREQRLIPNPAHPDGPVSRV